MLITVAICTRNRSASLARTLQSFERLAPIHQPWELLVVDNGSTDSTQDVIASFAERLPIRREIAPIPGVANARNAATASARGIYMACTDDDVIVGADWLRAYVAAFARWPDAALFGGRIIPVLEEPVTPWFTAAMSQLSLPLAARDLADTPIAFRPDGDTLPFGANYAVRTEVQRLFPFDPELGTGKEYFGEETTCFMAMLTAGQAGWWLPDSVVEHMIAPERQNEAYVARWFKGLGRTEAWRGECQDGPRLLGAPRWLWRRVATRTFDYHLSRLHAPPEIWVRKLMALAQDQGRIAYFRSAGRKGRRKPWWETPALLRRKSDVQ
jgi:hypothetical protein